MPSFECFDSCFPESPFMEFKDLDHGLAHVEHEDKFFTIFLRAHLILDMVAWFEVEDSTVCPHIRNFVEFEHIAELDWSRLLGLVEWR